MTDASSLIVPFLLTTLAGLSTGLGSLVVLLVRQPGRGFLAFMLGMSAGVMVLVSFVELLGRAISSVGFVPALIAFFAGMLALFLIDVSIPHSFMEEEQKSGPAYLARVGTMVALGLAIHNFPEGLTVFVGALSSPQLGVVLAIAIAIHNIPEGIAVAVPIFAASQDRFKALAYSFLSGVAEPVGSAIGAVFLLPFLTESVLSYVLAAVGGIMVFISLDELLPAAHKYNAEHSVILGVFAGMLIMAASLALLSM